MEKGLVRLDETDLKLMREFEVDARQSYAELAAKLELSDTGVRKRLHRLMKRQVIRVVAIANPLALGYPIRISFGMKVQPGQSKTVANQLARSDSISHIVATTGRYSIFAFGFFRNLEEVLSFQLEYLGSVSNLIQTESLLYLKTVKLSWLCFESEEIVAPPSKSAHVPDELDITMIQRLEVDPRISVKRLASQLGIPTSSAHRRLQILIREGVFKVVSIPDWTALGYERWAIVFVRISHDRILAVAEEMARYSQIKQVHIVLGRFDIILWGIFKDQYDMSNFTETELGSIEGVTSYEVLSDPQWYKYSWMLFAP